MSTVNHESIAEAVKSVLGRYHPWAVSNVTTEVLEAIADTLELNDTSFNRTQFLQMCGLEVKNTFPLCPKYDAEVLPDEDDLCSLCHEHSASTTYFDHDTGRVKWFNLKQLEAVA
jgi:hypothetical protein